MSTPYADFNKELIAAIPGAPDPYNILLARAAIAIAKLQQWQGAAQKREARIAELEAELAAVKKQEPVAIVGDVYSLYWIGSEPLATLLKRHPGVGVGSRLYAKAGAQLDNRDDRLKDACSKVFGWTTEAQPAISITKEQVRSVGGIVHSDGNVFFTSLDQLNALLNAESQPVCTSDEWLANCPQSVRDLANKIKDEVRCVEAARAQLPTKPTT